MKIGFIILLVLFIAENVFLRWMFKKNGAYHQKRLCHYCEMAFTKKEIKKGLTNCPYCGNLLSSWADYFEQKEPKTDGFDAEETKS